MKILLHICCANCALFPVKTCRKEGHNFAGFWFNPNIHPFQEYALRLDSLKMLEDNLRMDMIYTDKYMPEEYFAMFDPEKPDESHTENSHSSYNIHGLYDPVRTMPDPFFSPVNRCQLCYRLRLEKTAEQAQKHGFEAFTTSLLISPFQDFEQIVHTGKELAEKYNTHFYIRDFRQHFREAMSDAQALGFYRQKYCGCIYSKKEQREKRKKSKARTQKQ